MSVYRHKLRLGFNHSNPTPAIPTLVDIWPTGPGPCPHVAPSFRFLVPPYLTPASEGWYSIYLPQRDGRLSWPRWLVTYRDGLPAHRQSPIQVLTVPGVD